MSATEHDIAATHLRVCERFAGAVAAADGHWDAPSPCTDWDARAVVEHVIGFHDAMLLRPLGATPERTGDDPHQRWAVTVDALRAVFARPGFFDRVVEVPATGEMPATEIDARRLVPDLSTDTLVHTWDLARAVGGDDRLDVVLCVRFLAQLPADPDALAGTGLFKPAVTVADDADAQSQLLARFGRDSSWVRPAAHA